MSGIMEDGLHLVGSRHDSTGSIVGDSPEEYLNMMFDICRSEDGKASIALLLEEIQKTGIRTSDPRLEHMIKMLNSLKPHTLPSIEELKLDSVTFKSVLCENVVLVTKALQNQMIIPAFEAFCDNITDLYEKCQTNTQGKSAQYIQPLAQYGYDKWGVSVCTVDGQRFSIGDSDEPFTVQSTCAPVTYAICLNELGEKEVHKYQGRQPSGRMFNEIVLDYNNKPHNPLVASGSILSASLILQLVRKDLEDMSSKFEYVHKYFKNMAGGEHLNFNNSVFLSEKDSADRNYSLAYFMRESKCFPQGTDIKKVMDFHFQLCSLEMTCESLSVVAATLANGGVCPITGERVLNPETVLNVQSLMYSCGMYNYSGQFAFTVGLPAKSGGSGVLMLLIPNVMGVALWSPPLDILGNSCRGVQFCKELTQIYKFHRFDGVGQSMSKLGISDRKKVDPTFKKCETASEVVIQLLLAACSGDVRSLQRFWLQDVDLNVMDYDGRTALHLAAAEGHFETVKFLVEICKVNPNPMDRWNRTPLSESVDFNHARVASYLHHYIEEHPLWKYDESDFEDEEEEGEGEQTNGHEEHDSNGNEEQLVNYLDDEDDDQEVEDIVGNGKHVRTSLEEVEDQDLTNASDQDETPSSEGAEDSSKDSESCTNCESCDSTNGSVASSTIMDVQEEDTVARLKGPRVTLDLPRTPVSSPVPIRKSPKAGDSPVQASLAIPSISKTSPSDPENSPEIQPASPTNEAPIDDVETSSKTSSSTYGAFLDPMDVFTPPPRVRRKSFGGTTPSFRVNTRSLYRSPRLSPRGSPTLPRAQFSQQDLEDE